MTEPQERHCYVVIGGELQYVHQEHFRDLDKVRVVGFFGTRDEASAAWLAASQKDVDNAHMRYRIIKVY
jgi:hypothetical protein